VLTAVTEELLRSEIKKDLESASGAGISLKK